MSRLNMLNCIRNMVEVCLNSARSSTDLFSSLIGVRRDPFIVHCKYVESALELDVHCSKEFKKLIKSSKFKFCCLSKQKSELFLENSS